MEINVLTQLDKVRKCLVEIEDLCPVQEKELSNAIKDTFFALNKLDEILSNRYDI